LRSGGEPIGTGNRPLKRRGPSALSSVNCNTHEGDRSVRTARSAAAVRRGSLEVMCGRYASAASRANLLEQFLVADQNAEELKGPDFNVAPTKQATRVVPHVVRNPGNPWWNRRKVRAAASAKTLVEGVSNAECLPRNEKALGSVPRGSP
jgi:hypothetical protein